MFICKAEWGGGRDRKRERSSIHWSIPQIAIMARGESVWRPETGSRDFFPISHVDADAQIFEPSSTRPSQVESHPLHPLKAGNWLTSGAPASPSGAHTGRQHRRKGDLTLLDSSSAQPVICHPGGPPASLLPLPYLFPLPSAQAEPQRQICAPPPAHRGVSGQAFTGLAEFLEHSFKARP